mgnify:CR=1 FL=1
MTQFEDRERAFETKFARDEEMNFRILARRNRLLGEWAARKMGLTVLAGHGLTYRNIDGIAAIADIEELNIGHSIISRASLVGLDAAVREMIALMQSPRKLPGTRNS